MLLLKLREAGAQVVELSVEVAGAHQQEDEGDETADDVQPVEAGGKVKEGAAKAEAEELKKKLEEAGAKVELK